MQHVGEYIKMLEKENKRLGGEITACDGYFFAEVKQQGPKLEDAEETTNVKTQEVHELKMVKGSESLKTENRENIKKGNGDDEQTKEIKKAYKDITNPWTIALNTCRNKKKEKKIDENLQHFKMSDILRQEDKKESFFNKKQKKSMH